MTSPSRACPPTSCQLVRLWSSAALSSSLVAAIWGRSGRQAWPARFAEQRSSQLDFMQYYVYKRYYSNEVARAHVSAHALHDRLFYINSLPTNDAYMRHEILYAKRPMTHIRVMTNDRSLTAKLHSREIPTLNISVIMN